MKPRLKQPLFSVLEQAKLKTQFASDFSAANIIRAYDVLWNEFYMPRDVAECDVDMNTGAVLEMLGSWIELKCGEGAFEQPEPAEQEYVQLDLFDFIKNSDTKSE